MTPSRRTFLRGAALGAGGLCLPDAPGAPAAAGQSGGRPARVLFFVQGNGLYPAETQPAGIGRPRHPEVLEDRGLEGGQLAFSMGPLAPWAERMTYVHGLSCRVARGSHNSGFAALGCWPMAKKAFGETIDAALARALGGVFRHVGLGVSNKPGSLTYNLTSAAKGKALPTLLDPVLAARQFFAAGAAGSARGEFDADTQLLDFLADGARRAHGGLAGAEREKIERYGGAFESMSARQGELAGMADRIASAAPSIDPRLAEVSDDKTGPTGVFDRLEAQFEIAAGAMISGLTNTVTVSAGAGPDRIGLSCMASEVGEGEGYIGSHGIGHGGAMGRLSAARCHALIRRKCLEKLALFLGRLAAVPEGGGTMLDNTLVVYLSDSAEGHHPLCEEWPVVLIGDLGGRLRGGGRYLRYPWYGKPGHRTLGNLYAALLHAVGEPVERFGLPDSRLGEIDRGGPLTEILA